MQLKNIPQHSRNLATSSTRYLSAQDLIELHRAISADFGGTQAHGGEVESQFGLSNSVERPQTTVFGKDAFATLPDKAASFVMAILQNAPFRSGNRRLALASLFAFLALNKKTVDTKVLDEKAIETLIRKAANSLQNGVPSQEIFAGLRDITARAIS
ncbi:MAG: Fic family protein [Acidobacteriota bacterium]